MIKLLTEQHIAHNSYYLYESDNGSKHFINKSLETYNKEIQERIQIKIRRDESWLKFLPKNQ